jgi:exosortase
MNSYRSKTADDIKETSLLPWNALRMREMPWKLGTLMLLFLLLYAPLYPLLFETWLNDSNNSHGLLVPIVSLYLVWLLRPRISTTEQTSSRVGLAILVCSLVAYFVTYVADLTFPARVTMISTLAGLVLFNYGWKIFSMVLFPVLFLLFMVPVPDTFMNLVAFPLQLFVTDVSAHVIDWYGIPVYQDGNLLRFARYAFEVTEACSGIRSLVSFLALGALLAYIERDMWVKGVILLVSTVPLAIVVNLARVTGTGILANYFGPKVAQGFLHDFSGFVVFGCGIVLIMGELWLLNKLGFTRRTTPKQPLHKV